MVSQLAQPSVQGVAAFQETEAGLAPHAHPGSELLQTVVPGVDAEPGLQSTAGALAVTEAHFRNGEILKNSRLNGFHRCRVTAQVQATDVAGEYLAKPLVRHVKVHVNIIATGFSVGERKVPRGRFPLPRPVKFEPEKILIVRQTPTFDMVGVHGFGHGRPPEL
jgi:hypothetical protein